MFGWLSPRSVSAGAGERGLLISQRDAAILGWQKALDVAEQTQARIAALEAENANLKRQPR